MRKLHTVGLRVVAVLAWVAFGAAVSPSSAEAGTYPWVICGSGGPVGTSVGNERISLNAAPGTFVSPCFHNNNSVNSATRRNDFNTFTQVHAPAGATIVNISLDAVGNNYAFNRGWGYLVYTGATSFFCSFYENQFPDSRCGDGIAGFSTAGPRALPLPFDSAGAVYLGIYCRNLGGCDVGTLDFQAKYLSVEVKDETPPTLNVAGAAWTSDVLSGAPVLRYTATDNAAGTQGVSVSIDGVEKVSTVASDSGGCDSTSWHRCPDDSGSVALPLGGVGDGPRLVTVKTSDSVGNESQRSRSVVVDNVPPTVGDVTMTGVGREAEALQCAADVQGQSPRTGYQWSRANADGSDEKDIAAATASSYTLAAADVGRKVLCRVTGTDGGGSTTRKSTLTSGPFAGGAVVVAKPGGGASAPSTTTGAGADGARGLAGSAGANGSAAAAAAAAAPRCRTATVRTFGTASTITRSYARSGVPLAGRLVDASGEPKVGQVLDLVQTVVRSGVVQRKKIGLVRTGGDGRFRVSAPPGPSRALQLIDPGCGTVGPIVTERVRGALTAKTTTPRVRNRQTARITGRVRGGYVGRGISLELQVKVGRQWRDVKHATSNARGEFRVNYRFLRTYVRYTYAFRVVTRAGGAWPFMPATSRIVKVRVN